MNILELKKALKDAANPSQAKILQRFFKTGKGEYGEGDVFYGIKVPVIRGIAKSFIELNLNSLNELISSPVHEERLTAMLILVAKYSKGDDKQKGKIYEYYVKNKKYINNWDLVDLSAPNIIGNYLLNRDKKLLYDLSVSDNLWDRRISILSTFPFIRAGEYDPTFKIADILIRDKHDLIHKAVGWMLREIGKRDKQTETDFLKTRYKTMPRTMLRYAIEKFPQKERQAFLKSMI